METPFLALPLLASWIEITKKIEKKLFIKNRLEEERKKFEKLW